MSDYLKTLERFNIAPNFWCSEEYFQKAGFDEIIDDKGIISVWDEDVLVFPEIDRNSGSFVYRDRPWSELRGYSAPYFWERKFLDYEYLFRPKDFQEMKGNKWMTFRKNVRKFPRRYLRSLVYVFLNEIIGELDTDQILFQLNNLLIKWLEGKNEIIHDSDILEKYIFEGENRKCLIDSSGEILGVNIWDESYKFINFRYCLVSPKSFLSEYMRWKFYTDPIVIESGKLVNDGGILDNPDLKRFKDKMNPCFVNEIFTYS